MAPILDITTLIKRPQIRIDGKTYELYNRAELPIVTAQKLRLLTTKVTTLEAIKKPTKAQQADYLKALREFVGLIVVGLPPAVRGRLLRSHLVSIVLAFFQHPPVTTAARAATKGPK